MSFCVLISHPDTDHAQYLKNILMPKNYLVDLAFDGKDCQGALYKKKYDVLILDLDTRDHSAFEVLRYIKSTRPGLRVIVSLKNKHKLTEIGLAKQDFTKIGVSELLIRPYSDETFLNAVEGVGQLESWKFISQNSSPKEEEADNNSSDDEFTRIKIEEFSSHNTNIFDFYIRLGPNKYVKILHKGDFFDQKRWLYYKDEKKIDYIYFKNRDRSVYINFVNETLKKMLESNSTPMNKKIKATKSLVEKYVEEIYMTGLRPDLLEEGKKICENISKLAIKDRELCKLMRSYEEYDPPEYCHLFLVSLFSALICKNLEWVSDKTIELIAFGALLHDVGKLKLPEEFKSLKVADMNDEQFLKYQQHPDLAVNLLRKNPFISEPVIQIVFQHHERADGTGFPNGLTLTKTYPLAKVVGLADYFSEILIDNRISPIEGLNLFIPDRTQTICYDPVMIKALVKSFSK